MQHDINPDGSRLKAYRPYIFGEQKVWDTSMYDPFRSVDFGLYSSPMWTSPCFDQHNCFDKLAPKSHKRNVIQYTNRVYQDNLRLSPPADYSPYVKQSQRDAYQYRNFGMATGHYDNNQGVLYRKLESL